MRSNIITYKHMQNPSFLDVGLILWSHLELNEKKNTKHQLSIPSAEQREASRKQCEQLPKHGRSFDFFQSGE